MTGRPLILLGSARKQSDTRSFVEYVFGETDHTLLDLLDFTIAPYNYEESYPGNDQFPDIIEVLLDHSVIVFATPVYWYAMSWPMKIFFDRLNDLVSSRKHIGRKLKGKSVLLLSVGADAQLPEGFEIPFKCTAEYLDMIYRGCIYSSVKFPWNEERQIEDKKIFLAYCAVRNSNGNPAA